MIVRRELHRQQEQALKLSEVYKVLLDEERLRIVGRLAIGPVTRETLIVDLTLKSATIARHLTKLTEAGRARSETRDGLTTYELQAKTVQQLKRELFALAESEQRLHAA